MFKLKKSDNELGGYDYKIIDQDKEWFWYFAGNLDLYWTLVTKSDNNFIIKLNENDKIYYLIDELYQRILRADNDDYFKDYYDFEKEDNEFVIHDNYHNYDNYNLVDLDKKRIRYMSDEGPEGKTNEVIIHQEDDSYRLEFIHLDLISRMHGIRFRCSGSRYGSFFTAFVHAYQQMDEVYRYYPQITIDECVERNKVLIKE